VQQNLYFRFLRSWSALILLGIVVSVIATNYSLSQREPLYRATSTIQVGRLLDDKSPSQNDLVVIERLIPAYGETAQRDPVLQATSDSLGISMSPDDIRSLMLVTAVPQTQFIDIQIVSADPMLSAAIANEVARQIVLQSPDNTPEDASPAFIQSQLEDLQVKILQAQEEAAEIDRQVLELTSAAQVFEAQERRKLLGTQIEVWQQTYATMLAAAEPAHSNVVQIASNATPPSQPIPIQTNLYYGLAIVVGGGLATILALGLSALGRNLSDPREIAALAGSAPVVSVPRYRRSRGSGPIALREPDSVATGAYRVLRNTLLVQHREQGGLAIAVTSSKAGEGKTTTVANLGVALANSGLSVLLVDANLRNPELDQLLDVDGTVGFSDLLLGAASVESVRQPTQHPRLWVVGSGTVSDHYTDLLSSVILGAHVDDLSATADVVLFDTPAIFQEQECQLLARHVDGVVVIAEAGRVRGDDLEKTLQSLKSADATVMAIVVNKIRHRQWSTDSLPWSRNRRLRARAEEHRKRHMREDAKPDSIDAEHIPSTAD
jgi:capsular exopolysaccharide synthesis family protein